MANLIEESKHSWKGNKTLESINAGSLQRIADATEAMAKNHIDLQRDFDYVKSRMKYYQNRCEQLERSNRGLKAWITRLRNKAKQK